MNSLFLITLYIVLRRFLTTKNWEKCTASLFKPSFMLPSSFSDSILFIFSRLWKNAFYPRSIPQFSSNPNGAPARSRFFHVPQGFDKSRYRRPSLSPHTRFSPRVGPRAVFPRRIFGWKFERRPEKQESKPGEIGSWKGLLYPGFTGCCGHDSRRDSRLFIGDARETSENCIRSRF